MKFTVLRREQLHESRLGEFTMEDQWYWNLKAPNGKIVASGGEGYWNLRDLILSVRLYIVRDDPDAEFALRKALKRAGYDSKGRRLKGTAK